MKSTVEKLEPTKVKLSVEVDYDEFKPAMDKAYKEIAKQVSIPGFRKGHAPARVIDNYVGRAYVIEQAVNDALPGYYMAAVQEQNLQVMAQPQIDVTDVPAPSGPAGGKLAFTAEVEIVPDFDLPDFSEVEIEVTPAVVDDEAVDAELTKLRERFGSLKGVDRPVIDGDFVSLDLRAEIDGEEIDSVSGVSYQVGSKSMLEGMDETLVGMSAGEEKTYQTKLSGGEHAGEEADVTLKVNSVKERELPEVDEDFVQLASEFDTVEEFMEDLKQNVAKSKTADQALEARDKLLDYLRENVEIELPAGVVAAEIDARTDEKTTDEQRADIEKMIRAGLRDQLLLERLAQERNAQISQNELIDFVVQTARGYGMDPTQLLQGGEDQIQALAGELMRTKGLALTLAEVKVKDTDGNEIDLSEFTRDPNEAAELAAEVAEAEAGAEEAAEAEEGEK